MFRRLFLIKAAALLSQRFGTDPSGTLVGALAVLFFCVSSFFSWQLGPLVNSPDEMANRAFAEQFSKTAQLGIPAPTMAQDFALAPRSVSLVAGEYVPASFWGLPVVYGSFMAIFGASIIWFLTPLMVTLAGLAFCSLIRKIWGKSIALVSGLLYFLHPVVWYYTVRGLFNNALFVSLLIIGLYCVVVRPLRMKRSAYVASICNDVAAYAFILLALFVRTSEAVWVGALLLLLWPLSRGWQRRLLSSTWLVCLFLSGSAAWLLTSNGFGDFWRGGYVIQGIGDTIVSLFFPFGFHPRGAASAVWEYGFLLLTFAVLTGTSGFFVYGYKTIRTKKVFNSPAGVYTILFALLAWYPVLMYGSWFVADNPTPWLVTIGNAYLRYWLPLWIFVLPFTAYLLVFLFEKYKEVSSRYAAVLWIGFFACWLVQGVYVFAVGSDGYIQLARQQQTAERVREAVLQEVQPDDVLVTDRWDKIFWPNRMVVRGVHTPEMQDKIAQILQSASSQDSGVAVFYFGLRFTPKEEDDLRKRNALLAIVRQSFGDHVLYRLQFPPTVSP